MNPYEELGVKKDATRDQIRRAYRHKAAKHHPDKGGDTEAFKIIAEAYRTLANDKNRKRYDETGETSTGPRQYSQAKQLVCKMFLDKMRQSGFEKKNHFRSVQLELLQTIDADYEVLRTLNETKASFKYMLEHTIADSDMSEMLDENFKRLEREVSNCQAHIKLIEEALTYANKCSYDGSTDEKPTVFSGYLHTIG